MYTPKKVAWDGKFSTGDENMDFQHRYLFETLNHLGEMIGDGASKESVNVIVGRLQFYAEWHFSREEECMLMHKCPAADANKRAHALFIKMLNGYLKDMKNEDRFQELAAIVHADLLMWLESHILNVDTQLRGCVNRTTAEG